MRPGFKKAMLFLLLSALVLAMTFCGNDHPPAEATSAEAPDPYLNHSDTAHYVGMGQCKLCHQGIYDSFIQTGMGQSFDHASKQKSSAKFDAHTVIYDKYSDFYYHPFWDGDSLKIMEFRLQGKDTIYKRIERVDYIVGSGQHTNSHIQSVNGYLNQMPMTFYTQKGQWDLPPGFEGGFNTRFSRKIGLECMSCHNTLPGFVEGSENKFSSVPEGVNCERCHGPGSIHVQQRSSGSRIDTSKYIDYSIVNPGKLSIERQFDVCQRCHLQGNAVLKEGKSFFDFKPGMKLSDYMTVFLPRYTGADKQFIMASHADRLKQSKCFIKSLEAKVDTAALRPYKNALTCVTCHNPHVSVKVTGEEVFNNACRNCHNTTTHNGLCTEKEQERNKVQDNCVACHMPRSGSIDIPHVTVHDHFIRKPMKEEEVEQVKKFIGLYAVNEKNPSPLTKAKAYIQQYDKFEYDPVFLDSAEALLNGKAITDQKQSFALRVHLYFMKKNYAGIIAALKEMGEGYALRTFTRKSWDNNDAWTLYRIGEAYYNTSDLSNAYAFYKKADELAPYNPEFGNKLGAALMALNRIPEAVNVFESILKENPKFVPALTNLGYANLVAGRAEQAEAFYKKALALDPDYEPLLMNVAGLKIYRQDYKEAVKILEKVLKKNPRNEQAKGVLLKLKSVN